MAENFVNGWLYKTFINDPYKDPDHEDAADTSTTWTWTVPGFHETVVVVAPVLGDQSRPEAVRARAAAS